MEVLKELLSSLFENYIYTKITGEERSKYIISSSAGKLLSILISNFLKNGNPFIQRRLLTYKLRNDKYKQIIEYNINTSYINISQKLVHYIHKKCINSKTIRYTNDIYLISDEFIKLDNVEIQQIPQQGTWEDFVNNINKDTGFTMVVSGDTYQAVNEFLKKVRSENINQELGEPSIMIFKCSSGYNANKKDKEDSYTSYCQYSWSKSYIVNYANFDNKPIGKNVKEQFVDDFHNFLHSKEVYKKKGTTYKRGYILHGPPGTGKSTICKILFKDYPIFILDFSVITTNTQFTEYVESINRAIQEYELTDRPYVLLVEDIDRTSIAYSIQKHNSSVNGGRLKGMVKQYGNIQLSPILNWLDGLDSGHNRIIVMTCNDLSVLEQCRAFVRPGRIDKIVEVDYCTKDQIKKLLEIHYKDVHDFDLNINITISKLSELINTKDVDHIYAVLNGDIQIDEECRNEYINNEEDDSIIIDGVKYSAKVKDLDMEDDDYYYAWCNFKSKITICKTNILCSQYNIVMADIENDEMKKEVEMIKMKYEKQKLSKLETNIKMLEEKIKDILVPI